MRPVCTHRQVGIMALLISRSMRASSKWKKLRHQWFVKAGAAMREAEGRGKQGRPAKREDGDGRYRREIL